MGQDSLQQAGITLLFVDNAISMLECTVAICTHEQLIELEEQQNLYLQMQDVLHCSFGDMYKVQYKKSEYKAVNIREIVDTQCAHLQRSQREDMFALLSCFPDLFSIWLQKCPKDVQIDIDQTFKPIFQRHYAILHHNLAIFRYKVDGMVEQDVVEKAAPLVRYLASFGMLKPNNTMLLVTDLCKLSLTVKWQSYTMPLIPQLIRKYSSYR
jgi:hypothetical protein